MADGGAACRRVSLRTLPSRDRTAVAQRAGAPKRYDGIFDGYNRPGRLLQGLRRDVRRPGQRPRALQGHLRRACPVRRLRAGSPLRRARPRVHRPGHHVLAVRAGTPVPARPGAAGDLGGRVVAAGAGHHPAGQGAGALPRRHLRRTGDPARRRHPAPAGHVLRALPPRGRGHRPAQRGAHPRRRHRPDPRRGRAPSGCSRTTCARRRGCPT